MDKQVNISDFLGLRKSTLGILFMVILVGMGERMAERFLPIYLIALGGGSISIGLLNGLDNLLSALYAFPGGYLSDRMGTKNALLVFNIIAMFGYLIVILVPYWQAVILGAIFFLSWSAISLPATMSLIARVLPISKRTMGVSMHSLVRRIPMGLGPILGGVCIGLWGERNGVRLAFVCAFALAIVATILQQILIEEDSPKSAVKSSSKAPEKNPVTLFREMNSSLRRLLVSDILVRFCEQIPYAFVVVWCMKTINEPVSALSFGVLTGIEMATAMLVYIPVAYLRGLKEFGEPTRKALIMDLAPDDRKAAMFGLYYLLRDTVVSIAAFGGAFLWQIGPFTNFIVAFLFGVAGTAFFALYGTDFPNSDLNNRLSKGF
jgi:MFS family permease